MRFLADSDDRGGMVFPHYPVTFVLVQLLLFLHSVGDTLACPRICFCQNGGIVRCERKRLPFIPEGIASDTKELNLNNNDFGNPILKRSNFTTFKFLINLYMSACGIERLEPETFADTRQLRWLDLSNNRLQVIEDHTFRGLALNHLFLNDNPGIRFSKHAFDGLHTLGLYLHRCALSHISLDVVRPLNGTLQKLWLDDNDFESFSVEWSYFFKKLSHLRLNENRFHCNCKLKWLRNFYASNSWLFKPDQRETTRPIPLRCESPPQMRDKLFHDLEDDVFSCLLPIFQNVEIDLDINSGRLKCSASGDPTPVIYWVLPSKREKRYEPATDEGPRMNSGVLIITRPLTALRETYQCKAGNPAGNVSLAVNVTWPPVPVHSAQQNPTLITDYHRYNQARAGSGSAHPQEMAADQGEVGIRSRTNMAGNSVASSSSYSRNARPASRAATEEDVFFSLVQLVSAIIGTFLLTLLVCILLFHFYYKHQAHLLFREPSDREKTPDNVYITAEIDEATLKMMNHGQIRRQQAT